MKIITSMYCPIMAETNTCTYVHFTLSSLGQVHKKIRVHTVSFKTREQYIP